MSRSGAAAELRNTLERLEAHWRTQGAPIADHLAPGATEEEIASLEARAGIVLPDVARELFQWHDGATANGADITSGSSDTFFGPGTWRFLSLREMTDWVLNEWRVENLEWAAELPQYSPEGPWPKQWFPLFNRSDEPEAIVIRCYEHRVTDPTPVARAHLYENDPDRALQHFDLVSLLQTWLMWFDLGAIRWDEQARRWLVDDERYSRITYRSGFW
jgi:hypothetical protein